MDAISIAPLVITAWELIAPYAKKIAGQLAQKTEAIIPDAVEMLWNVIRTKMEGQPETDTLPTELIATPEDPIVQGAFQYQLKKLLENDASFARELEELVEKVDKVSRLDTVTLNEGDGAIAQGINAIAAGKRGVNIRGNASQNLIITGDDNVVNSEKPKNKKRKQSSG